MDINVMEYMVKKKMTAKDKMIRSMSLAAVVAFFGAWFLFAGIPWMSYIFLALAIIMIIINKLLIYPGTDLEYEYLYCDRQITIDKIMGKSRRKNVAVYDTGRIELMCPENSYRADEYKNRNFTVCDYSSGRESEDYTLYAVYYEGNKKILLDLPVEFVKMVQSTSPRKVFLD